MSTYLGSIPRRALLGALGGTSLGLACGLFSNIRVASAQALTGGVPEVDSLSVQVVTDTFRGVPTPPGKFGAVVVQRDAPSRPLRDEFGLALHLESTRGPTTRRILVDFGDTGHVFNSNMEALGIDPAPTDYQARSEKLSLPASHGSPVSL